MSQTEARLLLFGNFGTGKTTLGKALSEQVLGWPFVGLDECRRQCSDGSAAGEMAAWSSFLREAEAPEPRILECSGSGPFTFLLQHAVRRFRDCTMVFWLHAPLEVCLGRCTSRKDLPPYPDFGVPYEDVIADVQRRVEQEIDSPSNWRVPRRVLNATLPPPQVLSEAEEALSAWFPHLLEGPP